MKKNRQPYSGAGITENDSIVGRGMIAGIAFIIIVVFILAVVQLEKSGDCDRKGGSCVQTSGRFAPPATAPAVIKSDRPLTELYVMSFCPYGIYVENAFRPVVDLLGNSTDIQVRYIATVPGNTIDTAQSLHGNVEAIEDVRQLCIAKHDPEKFWKYLAAFNTQCYPVWNNPAAFSACQKNITAALGIQMPVVDQCTSGSEGLGLLKADEARSISSGAQSSPSLLINGQKYSGPRTSEAFKQAVCSHFESPPSQCDTVPSSQPTAASGSC
ncbi:MAG: hypothetical protein A4E35_01852 [Methanoregula sp. PtaU1.Bin051]|nr:MAG: hypothetical protein A4E35_01852 [Methanoregula sp. PtaU1.Bin051]